MQRDSDSDCNGPSGGQEDDQMLRPNEKKAKRKKSKPPVIVPAAAGQAGNEVPAGAGRVSVVQPPSESRKNQVLI